MKELLAAVCAASSKDMGSRLNFLSVSASAVYKFKFTGLISFLLLHFMIRELRHEAVSNLPKVIQLVNSRARI